MQSISKRRKIAARAFAAQALLAASVLTVLIEPGYCAGVSTAEAGSQSGGQPAAANDAQIDDALKLLALSLKCPVAFEDRSSLDSENGTSGSSRGTITNEFEGDRNTLKVHVTTLLRISDLAFGNFKVEEGRYESHVSARFDEIDATKIRGKSLYYQTTHKTLGHGCANDTPCLLLACRAASPCNMSGAIALNFCDDGAADDALAAIDLIQGSLPGQPNSTERPDPPGWVGMNIKNAQGEPAGGALVVSVEQRGPADKARFQPGDIIVKFGGAKIQTAKELARLAARTPIGADVAVLTIHDGEEETRIIRIGRRPDDSRPDSDALTSLGLELSALSDGLRKKYGIGDDTNGVLVTGVGVKQGLQVGDVILEAAGKPVMTPSDLREQVKEVIGDNKLAILLRVKSGDHMRFVALSLDGEDRRTIGTKNVEQK